MTAVPQARERIPVTFEDVFQAKPKQRLLAEAMWRGTLTGDPEYLLWGGSAGPGKLLSLDEPIPTPTGWKRNGDLQAGDVIFDEHGKPCNVTYAFDIEEHPVVYRLTFDDGSTMDAGADHQWLTYDAAELSALTTKTPEWRAARRERRPSRALGTSSESFVAMMAVRNQTMVHVLRETPQGSIRTTAEIAATLRTPRGRANHAIPVAAALQCPPVDLPLDPYLLGVWLGDGTSSTGTITTMDIETVWSFHGAGFVLGAVQHAPGNKASVYRFAGLTRILRQMGVLKNKHIPQQYLRASYAQRLALLRGLMDTDGTCGVRGDASFGNTNKAIIDGVYELVVSLGWKAYLAEGRAKLNGKDYGPKWDVSFAATEKVFLLHRKAVRQKIASRRTTRFRYVTDCVEVESKPMRCISVDSPSRLFLAGLQMVPTHNSWALRWCAVLFLIWCYTVLKLQNVRVGLFCVDYPQLKDRHVNHIEAWPEWLGTYNDSDHDFTLHEHWGGGILSLRNLDKPEKYASAEFAALFIDELTELDRETFEELRTRKRWPGVPYSPVVCTCNPRHRGLYWVRKLWIERDFSNDGDAGLRTHSFWFMQALPEDNDSLPPSYYDTLRSLGPLLQRQLLRGDWYVSIDQAFPQFSRWKRHARTGALLQDEDGAFIPWHVIPTTEVPETWKRVAAHDWGSDSPGHHLWAAIDPRGGIVVYREWRFRGLDPQDIAAGVLFHQGDDRVTATYADPSIWAETRRAILSADQILALAEAGKLRLSKYEQYREAGLHVVKANNPRVAGKLRLDTALKDRGDGVPFLRIMDCCPVLIDQMANITKDPDHTEDVLSEYLPSDDLRDDAYDALRYLMMGVPSLVLKEIKSREQEETDPRGRLARRRAAGGWNY